jgi:hypothetical protein
VWERVRGKACLLVLFRYEGAHYYLDQTDLLSWLMEEAEGPQLRAEDLTKRVLIVNFVAIHVSIVVIGRIWR